MICIKSTKYRWKYGIYTRQQWITWNYIQLTFRVLRSGYIVVRGGGSSESNFSTFPRGKCFRVGKSVSILTPKLLLVLKKNINLCLQKTHSIPDISVHQLGATFFRQFWVPARQNCFSRWPTLKLLTTEFCLQPTRTLTILCLFPNRCCINLQTAYNPSSWERSNTDRNMSCFARRVLHTGDLARMTGSQSAAAMTDGNNSARLSSHPAA